MARNYAQGKYNLTHPEKYAGNKTPIYRSSWELTMMRFCDNNPAVIQWASEAIKIPYRNPLTGRNTVYVPDFFIVYRDRNGKTHAELIEVKPSKETSLEAAGNNARNRASVLLNYAKWEAAQHFCKRNGIAFRVISEKEIFHNGSASTKRKKT